MTINLWHRVLCLELQVDTGLGVPDVINTNLRQCRINGDAAHGHAVWGPQFVGVENLYAV